MLPVSDAAASADDPQAGGDAPGVLEAHQRCFEAGAVVFDEGDTGRTLYFIRSGEVELTRRGPSGPRSLARLGPGEFFGEQSALLAGPRRGRAAVVRDAELLEVSADVFEDMCLERPDIALRISRALTARADELEQRLVASDGEDGARSLVSALLRRAQPAGEGARVEATLRVLAGEAGCRMLEAHHALQQLVERKLVRLVEDVLIVPDLAALRESENVSSLPR
jgi:CRP/FNR family transcriptional regulator